MARAHSASGAPEDDGAERSWSRFAGQARSWARRLARGRLSPEQRRHYDSEDAAQSALLRAVRGFSGCWRRNRARFMRYLGLCVGWVIVDRARRRRSEHALPPLDSLAVNTTGPAGLVEHQEELERLRQAISKLPAGQRKVIELFLAGWSPPDIARMLERKLDLVHQQLSRARRRLAERMG